MGKFVVSDTESSSQFAEREESVHNNVLGSEGSEDFSQEKAISGGEAVERTASSSPEAVDFLRVRRFTGDVAQRIRLTYEFPVDNYGVAEEVEEQRRPLYTEAEAGVGPSGISSAYTDMELFQRALRFYFNEEVQPLPPGWSVHSPSQYDRVPLVRGLRFALYTTCLSYGLRFPLTPFQRSFLQYHGVSPSVLPPNSWRILTAFEALCCSLVVRPTPTLFAHFYCFKRVREWYYLTARPSVPKIFGSLAESVRGWKEKFVVVSCPNGFDFPTTYSEPVRTEPVALRENDSIAWQELQAFMDERRWAPLNAQLIVKRWCTGQLAFDEEGTTPTSRPS